MKKIEFPGSQGHLLAARLDEPAGRVKAYALFAHCFTCGKDLQPVNRIAKALNDDGIAVLRFDFTGLGKSGGEFENTNFSSNVADLLAAADYMRQTMMAPALMIGHSLGGTATLVAATQVPEVKGVVTIGSPSNATNVIKQFKCDVETIEREGEAEVKLAGRPFKIRKQFLDDIRGQNVTDAVASLKKPLLVCHSPIDETVSIDHAGEIFKAAKHPKSFLSLNKADHLLFSPGSAEYVARSVAAWASSYIGNGSADGTEALAPHHVTVTSLPGHPFTQAVQMGAHAILADEPRDMGGEDAGPDPYSFLMAALGACTSMTLQLYARHKNLPLKGVEVHLTHDKIHAQDCTECETKEGKLDKFTRSILIKGDLNEEQRARMIEIADKCPVHRTLKSEIIVKTTQRKD